jgi:hypothetical protein
MSMLWHFLFIPLISFEAVQERRFRNVFTVFGFPFPFKDAKLPSVLTFLCETGFKLLRAIFRIVSLLQTIISPVVLYGCETWSLTLRKELRLRVFENRVLRRIFGPKRDEETGGWRKVYNEELHNLFSSPSIIRTIKSRRMRWAGHVARMEKRNAYRILVGEPEGKRPLGRPRRRLVNNMKLDFREIGWNGVGWIDTAQDRSIWRALVNTVLNLQVP